MTQVLSSPQARCLLYFTIEIDNSNHCSRTTHERNYVAHFGKKIQPAELSLTKILVQQGQDTTGVAPGIRQVDQKAYIGHTTQGSDQSLEKDGIVRDVNNIKPCPDQDHPPRTGQNARLKRYGANSHHKATAKNQPEIE